MTADETRRILLDWVAAVNAGDLAAVAAGFADDARWWVSGSLPVSGLYEGREAILRDFFAPSLELFVPGTFRLEVTSVIAEPGRAAIEWKGFADTVKGRQYRQLYHMAFELNEHGEIAAVREYNDTHYSHGVLFS